MMKRFQGHVGNGLDDQIGAGKFAGWIGLGYAYAAESGTNRGFDAPLGIFNSDKTAIVIVSALLGGGAQQVHSFEVRVWERFGTRCVT